jgi:hypothetical protein
LIGDLQPGGQLTLAQLFAGQGPEHVAVSPAQVVEALRRQGVAQL